MIGELGRVNGARHLGRPSFGQAVAGKVPVKRNRFIKPVGADKSVNRILEAKSRALAGIKGYITNVLGASPKAV